MNQATRTNAVTFEPIGLIRSCFPEKFGIPRQSGLVPEATARLEIGPPFNDPAAFRGLVEFSHIWILFVFHACKSGHWHPTVRPPRLGGNRRMGIFATRSGFRPNPIGQSVVELAGLEVQNDMIVLNVKGIDLLDGTPVLDIKPYLPYADCLPQASAGYARQPPAPLASVSFSPQAAQACRELEGPCYPDLQSLIRDLVAQDPRPAYRRDVTAEFGMRLWDLNIRFKAVRGGIEISSIRPCPTEGAAHLGGA